MNAQEYFAEIIQPTYAEHAANPADVRRAMLACMVAYHFVDVVALLRNATEKAVYAEFLTECPEFKAVKAVCLISKHVVPTQRDFSGITLTDLKRGRGAAFSDGSYYSDGTSHSDAPAAVTLQASAWRKTDVPRNLKAAVAYIESRLVRGEFG